MAKGKKAEWTTKDGLKKIYDWLSCGIDNKQLAHNMGIHPSTLYEWMNDTPEIKDTIKRAKRPVDDIVENKLFQRAVGYSYEEVTKERVEDKTQKKRHAGKGGLTEDEWNISKAYFGNRCAYCGADTTLTKDHIIPMKKGGKLEVSNIIPACGKCNSSKKDHDIDTWYKKQPFYSDEKLERIEQYTDSIEQLLEPLTKESDIVVTKIVKKEVAPDTTAQIFWLKNRRPELWRDRRDIGIDGNLEIEKGKLTDIMEQLKNE